MGFGVIIMEVSHETQRMCLEWREVRRSSKIRTGQKRKPRVKIGKDNHKHKENQEHELSEGATAREDFKRSLSREISLEKKPLDFVRPSLLASLVGQFEGEGQRQ